MTSGKYPTRWLAGYIIPIFKKGDALDPNNYRGITINSSIGKLFNMILNERITKSFTSRNIISKYQIGFKKDCRTTDHITVLDTLVKKYTSKGKNYILVL